MSDTPEKVLLPPADRCYACGKKISASQYHRLCDKCQRNASQLLQLNIKNELLKHELEKVA